jgi:hypothetical protein
MPGLPWVGEIRAPVRTVGVRDAVELRRFREHMRQFLDPMLELHR